MPRVYCRFNNEAVMLEEIDNINGVICKLEKQVNNIYATKERQSAYTQIRILKQTLNRLERMQISSDQKQLFL